VITLMHLQVVIPAIDGRQGICCQRKGVLHAVRFVSTRLSLILPPVLVYGKRNEVEGDVI
jgi:hypothetical protein